MRDYKESTVSDVKPELGEKRLKSNKTTSGFLVKMNTKKQPGTELEKATSCPIENSQFQPEIIELYKDNRYTMTFV
jgi:hypothetical protein